MKSNIIIAGLIILAMTGTTIAGQTGEVVEVGHKSTKGSSVIVYDAGFDFQSAADSLKAGEVDFVRFILPIPRPGSACNDAVDCAQTIKDTCEIIDPAGATSAIIVTYNGSSGSCEGTCADGQSVTVVCSRP